MSIKITHGDLLKQKDVDAIVNTVNCVGVMGKGIALQFKKKWPDNFAEYAKYCKLGHLRPGKVHVYKSEQSTHPLFIINFPTKAHWKEKSKIEYIRDGLNDLIRKVKDLNITSIAIPPLGCGNGGLSWDLVRPLIEEAFRQVPEVVVRLFEPNYTVVPKETENNLAKPKMTPGRAILLKLISIYRSMDYGISNIEIQKLAYFLQEAGADLKLNFDKHHYGPYADNLRHVLNRIDGHFIRGVGDGVFESEIELIESALQEADDFIQNSGNKDLEVQLKKVANLIDGFQSPYGMELLSSVHWLASYEHAKSASEVLIKIQRWNARKRKIMQESHIKTAWQRLEEYNWIQ
ncbi:type II toxin-antitoxin system antitoxin DNA ADP-ribosyl glycohydrolase DarG [Legionella feeleii]|uniref:RNase III inhibitor n=1 Tax=Legionella feeleii TaxID=453 RepID=A0A0W0TMA8_9GAMM|nr:macro domain-containing protein [Legionella feeleii]KTC96637.1 RNase III inhibitor [Legionella feeleii]SPX60703.1 RNase III inhibitor [Legionella feeleii]